MGTASAIVARVQGLKVEKLPSFKQPLSKGQAFGFHSYHSPPIPLAIDILFDYSSLQP